MNERISNLDARRKGIKFNAVANLGGDHPVSKVRAFRDEFPNLKALHHE